MQNKFRVIQNILQDSMIRIPYFISLQPTQTVALLYDKQISQFIEQNHVKGVLSTHKKLHYESQSSIPVKFLIIIFQNKEFAQIFCDEHSQKQKQSKENNNQESGSDFMNRFVNSLVQVQSENKIQTSKAFNFKTKIHYCKDISNLCGILFEKGKIAVQFPHSTVIQKIIRDVSRLVVIEGIRAEEELKKKISQQPVLEFIDHTIVSSENIFYRWRVYSYLQGDSDTNYRKQPFQIVADRAIWYPPQQSTKQKYHYQVLNSSEREYLTELLYKLSTKKSSIQEAMCFCIKNKNNFVDISCVIAVVFLDLATKSEASQSKVLPISFLISDILFNSTWMGYRDIFQTLIPYMINQLLKNIQEANTVSQLLDLWKKRYLFEQEYFKGLQYLFNKKIKGNIKPDVINKQLYQKQNDEIQQLCYRYGIPYNNNENIFEALTYILMDKNSQKGKEQDIVGVGQYDGQQLNQKDILRIKNKGCKVVNCSGSSVKSLFEKIKNPSISVDKQ